jgi:glycosyltransferase involved in cell wall biosynthesis
VFHLQNIFVCSLRLQINKSDINQMNSVQDVSISVVIPCCRNHIPCVAECLNTISKQTIHPCEVIISLSEVDMETAIACENAWKHIFPCLRVLFSESKLRAGPARNVAALESKCQVICFIDADDRTHPQKLEVIARIFNLYPDTMCVMHNFHSVSRSQNVYPDFELYDLNNVPIDRGESFSQRYNNYPDSTGVHHGHCAVSRRVFDDGHRQLDMGPGEDLFFVKSIMAHYNHKVVHVKLNLVQYSNL